MKKMLLLTAAVLLLLTGCGEKENNAAAAGTVLNVAIVNGDDKFAHSQDGNLDGIEPLLAKSAAETAGRELNLVTVNSEEELYSGIQDGSFDLGFGRLSETKDELKKFKVSRSYGKSGIYFLTKKYDFTDSLAILKSGTIGVMGSVKAEADEVPSIENYIVNDYTDCEELGRDVASGTVDIGLVNEREALSVIAASDKLQVQEVLNGPAEYYVAIMKDDQSLKTAVDSAISAYYDSILNTEEEQE